MPRGNPAPKLAITVDPDVHFGVLVAARHHATIRTSDPGDLSHLARRLPEPPPIRPI